MSGSMTGAEISAEISAIAADLYVANFHFPDSRRVTATGWPDHVLIGSRGLIYREVKGDGDQVSGRQVAVGYALKANGQDWDIWTKHDLASGRIRQEIEAIA